jgi:hypothetical protein
MFTNVDFPAAVVKGTVKLKKDARQKITSSSPSAFTRFITVSNVRDKEAPVSIS